MIQLIQLLSLLVIRLRTGMNAMIGIEELVRESYVNVNGLHKAYEG